MDENKNETTYEYCKRTYEYLKERGKAEEINKEFTECANETGDSLEELLRNPNYRCWIDSYYMIDEFLSAYMDEYMTEVQEKTVELAVTIKNQLTAKLGKVRAEDLISCLIDDGEIVFEGLI